mgnify:FL=1
MEYRNFIRLVGAMILLSVVLTAFHGSQKRIESTIDDAFKYAVDKDFQNRRLYLIRNQAIRYGVRDYALSPSIDQKIKSYSLRTQKGIHTYQFKDSIQEETAKRFLTQHLLEKVHRLNPNQVKKIFQDRLKEKDIEAKVGVLCLRDTVRYWSEADSIVPQEAYSTPRQVLDITGKMKVQAWADYSVGTIFAHLDPVMYVFLLLLIGVLMWIWPTKSKTSEQIEEGDVEGGLLIDLEKKELTIDGVSCFMPKLDLALLEMLYERKGECVTREEIKQQFWPTDANASEKIDTHIKTIRKTLKDFPQYQVVNVRGKGYYLEGV